MVPVPFSSTHHYAEPYGSVRLPTATEVIARRLKFLTAPLAAAPRVEAA